jgi:hypothetical protein
MAGINPAMTEQYQAASSRLISVSNAKRYCAPSSSGSQFVICGKMVRRAV